MPPGISCLMPPCFSCLHATLHGVGACPGCCAAAMLFSSLCRLSSTDKHHPSTAPPSLLHANTSRSPVMITAWRGRVWTQGSLSKTSIKTALLAAVDAAIAQLVSVRHLLDTSFTSFPDMNMFIDMTAVVSWYVIDLAAGRMLEGSGFRVQGLGCGSRAYTRGRTGSLCCSYCQSKLGRINRV